MILLVISVADILDFKEHALRRLCAEGVEAWTGEGAINWTAETKGPITRTGADHCAGVGDLCSPQPDRRPDHGVVCGPGLAPVAVAGRAGRADLLGGCEAATAERKEPPEEVKS